MPQSAVIGVDIGTSSSKGVLVDRDGTILARPSASTTSTRPRTGLGRDGRRHLVGRIRLAHPRALTAAPDAEVAAVGVSGMGPCVLLADEDDARCAPRSSTASTPAPSARSSG